MRLAGLILAGGLGQRMGGADKALVLLQGRPLVQWVAKRLSPQVLSVYLSANGDPDRFLPMQIPVLADVIALKGPLCGIHAGLMMAARDGYDGLVTTPVDVPFVPVDLVARLAAASQDPVVPRYARSPSGDHPACALWPTRLLPKVSDFLASAAKPKLSTILAAQGALPVDFDDDLAFMNVNSPADLALAMDQAMREQS